MAKGAFKTDGFKIAKDFMAKGIFSDVRVYKDRGYIEVIAVKDGLIYKGQLGTYFQRSYNKFDDQLAVNKAIDNFIAQDINGEEEKD